MSDDTALEEKEKQPAPFVRDTAVDRFRGFIVFCMVFFIAAGEFPCLGILARFANNGVDPFVLFRGMTIADLIDPIFLFIISISYQPSFERRYAKSGKAAYLHFLTRYLAFIGAGSILVSAEDLWINNYPHQIFLHNALMFAVLGSVPLMLICRLIRPIPKKVGDVIKTVCVASLLILGAFDIILGIRDDIVIFFDIDVPYYFKHWAILSEIGMTGLLVIPFLKLTLNQKRAAWYALVLLYTLFQTVPGVIDKTDVVVLGGLIGTVGWLILMLGGVILSTSYRTEGKGAFYLSLLRLSVLAVFPCISFPLVTGAVTVNYVLFSLLAAALCFAIVNVINKINPKFAFFTWWGENPLLLFFIGILFRGFELIWDPAPSTPIYVAAPVVFGLAAAMTVLAYYLHKKKIHFRF